MISRSMIYTQITNFHNWNHRFSVISLIHIIFLYLNIKSNGSNWVQLIFSPCSLKKIIFSWFTLFWINTNHSLNQANQWFKSMICVRSNQINHRYSWFEHKSTIDLYFFRNIQKLRENSSLGGSELFLIWFQWFDVASLI